MKWRPIVDFGLVVLIWMTQLIVYPGFTYYSDSDLLHWHTDYTTAITLIVGPLMLAQGVLHAFAFIRTRHWTNGLSISLLLLVWIHTFAFAVPLHAELVTSTTPLQTAAELVAINWYRTILWTLVFVLSLLSPTKN
jgi:DMSO reductase anchor subunit